ncbi:PBS lyase HEAT-like repeat protein [Calothrix parasitica NIES-267]|uniref:PBS lyase HEAT-like repeat protein n=1 Tax=Calothrix parasitica NIES-267 TaxID=1973488 RepID=A0A1Z4LIN0_9CYAN|nr:PBS lyase HEAT-like repeat protein [Calothrix parasitica NIES-267]
MSALTEALKRFEHWLWNNHPKRANSLPSGLTSEEINYMAQSLPFSLSEEIKELYQWSNGCSTGLVTLSIYCDEIIGFMP